MIPLFICGAMRSGTTLLLSLFDSHPDLCVFPVETYFSHTIADLKSLEEKRRRILLRISDRLEVRKMGDKFLEALKDELQKAEDDRELFYAFFRAFCRYQGSDIGRYKYLVEKTPKNNERYAPLLLQLFPDARFVHIFRDPRDIFASRFKATDPAKRIRSVYEMDERWNKSVANSLRFKDQNQHSFVMYEKLITQPKETMQSLCRFLDIPWHDCLMISSLRGEIWEGNSIQGARSGGKIHSKSSGKYAQILSKRQLKRLEQVCYKNMKRVGYVPEYAKEEKPLSFWYRVYRVVRRHVLRMFKYDSI